MADKNKYTKDIEERANRARAINLANRNRAISYLRSAPSLSNVINAARYYWLSNPHLGGENEEGATEGIAPIAGRAGGYRTGYAATQRAVNNANRLRQTVTPRSSRVATQAKREPKIINETSSQVEQASRNLGNTGYKGYRATNATTSTRTNLGTGQTTRLNYKSPTGKHAARKNNPSDATRELEGTLDISPTDKLRLYSYANPGLTRAARFMTTHKDIAGLAIVDGIGLVAGGKYIYDKTKKLTRLANRNESTAETSRNTTNHNSTTTPKPSATKVSTNTTNASAPARTSNSNAVTNTNLPDVNVTSTRRNKTSNVATTAPATAKPATRVAAANSASPQKQTTAPATRRTNTTARPTRLANRNEYQVNGNSVKVKAGDTLYAIAKRLTGDGNNYKEFLKYNNIKDPNKIYAGDNLVIPEKFRKIKSNAERRNAAHQAERLRRVKERANFALPDNLDEEYAQLQPREGGRRTLETAGRY